MNIGDWGFVVNLRVLTIAGLILVVLSGTVAAVPDKTFPAIESHELSEMLFWGAGFRDGSLQNILWDDASPGVCRSGRAGVLFDGATAKDGTVWEEGVTSKLRLCPPTDGLRFEIAMPISPLYIGKKLTGRVDELNLAEYLRLSGANITEVWNKGRSGWGEKAFLLDYNGATVWLVLRTEHGLNGLVGTTQLAVFGKRSAAEKDSETEKHY
jgi:hypothetical protein